MNPPISLILVRLRHKFRKPSDDAAFGGSKDWLLLPGIAAYAGGRWICDAVVLVRLRHKLNGDPANATISGKTAHRLISQRPRHCWASAICDTVVLGFGMVLGGAMIGAVATGTAPR